MAWIAACCARCMVRHSIALMVGLLVSLPALAFADIAPDPCDVLELGDECETERGQAGVCVEGSRIGLVCQPNATDGGGGAGGEGGTPAAGGNSEGGGGSPSEGGSGGSGGSGGGSGSTADDGCQAAAGPSNKMLTASGLVGLAALAFAGLRRRERAAAKRRERSSGPSSR